MDISKRYSVELNKINNHLTDLERGRIYELTQTPGTPSCATMAQHLREDISTLLDLIENDKPGVLEKVSNVTNKIKVALVVYTRIIRFVRVLFLPFGNSICIISIAPLLTIYIIYYNVDMTAGSVYLALYGEIIVFTFYTLLSLI